MATNSDQGRPTTSADGEIHEPALGVYALTEFVYCPRAGLCTFETGHEEKDDIPPLSFFAFNPLYSLAEIEADLEKALNEMTWLLLCGAFSAGLGFLVSVFFDKLLGLVGVIPLAWFCYFAANRGMRALHLQRQRKEALAAKGSEPNPNSEDVKKIYWWDLLKAGFETQSAQDRLIDEELNFSGKPSRFLRRGNVVIPVWRMGHYSGQLHPQNFIRMAAYCHLVGTSLGAGVECPYGVILFGHGFDGVAIPVSSQRQAEFLDALYRAREIIHQAKRRPGPHAPAPTLCAKCPHGEPKKRKPNESDNICNGKTLLVIPAVASDSQCFHSLCGDRFRWLPPHEEVEKKDLRLQV